MKDVRCSLAQRPPTALGAGLRVVRASSTTGLYQFAAETSTGDTPPDDGAAARDAPGDRSAGDVCGVGLRAPARPRRGRLPARASAEPRSDVDVRDRGAARRRVDRPFHPRRGLVVSRDRARFRIRAPLRARGWRRRDGAQRPRGPSRQSADFRATGSARLRPRRRRRRRRRGEEIARDHLHHRRDTPRQAGGPGSRRGEPPRGPARVSPHELRRVPIRTSSEGARRA